ncbi:MAG: hypothetical protein WAK13_02210 [Terriglobales bacterium]
MANSIVNTIVDQLQTERTRLETELHRVSAALSAFGKAYMNGGKPKAAAAPVRKVRTISAAGRRRIAAAQKARWAKIRAAKKSKIGKA